MTRTVPVTMLLVLLPLGCGNSSDSAPPTTAPTTTPAPATTAPSAPATTRSAAEGKAFEDKLYGTWVADDVDVEIGQVRIKLAFREEGPMKLAAWSDIPFVGQVRAKTAPFEVNGNVISSQAIRGGTSVTYWFEGDDLVIQYKEGKTVRFQRQ